MDEEFCEHQTNMVILDSNGVPVVDAGNEEMMEGMEYEEEYDEDGFGRGTRMRGGFRGRMPGWMNGPMRPPFRGRGYGPAGPPMRGRGGFYRNGPRGPRFGNGYDGNWGPMGPPPPGMMGPPPPFGLPPPGMMGPPGGPMGPPPNMMGPPLPFGPPPMIPPELWVEATTDEGKSYYYNANSRETTWTRPQEINGIRVINQAEYEVMATSMSNVATNNNNNNNSNQPNMSGTNAQVNMNNNNNNGMMGQNMMGQNNMMPQYMGQNNWIKANNDGMEPQAPPGVDMQNSPNDDNNMSYNNNMTQFQMQQQSMQGASGNWWNQQQQGGNQGNNQGWAPNNVQQGSFMQGPMQQGPMQQGPGQQGTIQQGTMHQGTTQQGPNVIQSQIKEPKQVLSKLAKPIQEPIVIPPELEKAAAEWTTHKAPDGRPYYYHAGKAESVWEMPEPMKELHALKHKQALQKPGPELDVVEVIDVEAHEEAKAKAAAAKEAAEREKREAEERARREKEKQEEREAKERADREAVEKKKSEQDGDKPMWTVPITGTPWCVVWTRNGNVFFHNASAHLSVVNRPKQLYGRPEVDEAILKPPTAAMDFYKNHDINKTNGELKRLCTDQTSDGEEPLKKAKMEPVPATERKPMERSKEAAAEAEARAARERSTVPLEQRVERFREMLLDRGVSAFSTWDKELHKIVYDDRYLLLTSKERKQVFEKFLRDRAEEERKEKKNRLLVLKNEFRSLMDEAKIHPRSSYTEFAIRYCRDDRFRAVEKARDRETYFNEYISETKKREKEEKERLKEVVKSEFIDMLKEKGIDRHLRWPEAKKKVDGDPRYKAVDSSSLKESYYREYCRLMKEEKKKESKEKDRGSKKEKKDKEKKEKKEKKERAETDTSLNESSTTEVEDDEAAKAKAARVAASIAEREKQVQRVLATSLRDRDKEREFHKRDEAIQHCNALLADLVRNPDITWREARKQIKKDHRYELTDLLTKEEKERLFNEHISILSGKRRARLRTLLTELKVTIDSHWKDIKTKLEDEPRTPIYSSPDTMEREYREYLRDKQSAAKTALRQLLQETRSITHKSLATTRDNTHGFQLINDALKHDARYLALNHIPDERHQIILAYLDDLEKKGPPPPPTATEPTRRSKP